MEAQIELKDIKGFIRRRKKSFTIPFLLILIFAGGLAFLLPPVYRSESMIIVEGQQIPDEYVKTTITGYAEERLQEIMQQVMGRTKLMEIINQLNLYPEMRDRYTIEQIIAEMRKNINFETISASVPNKFSGRPGSATIAFTLSYDGRNPNEVQKVVNVLSSLFIEGDLRKRKELASTTTDFLGQELENLKEQIQVFEKKISEFKRAHIGELPEYNRVNLDTITRLEGELSRISRDISMLEERKVYLKAQIASVDPLTPIVTEQGKVAMNPTERLKSLRLRLMGLQSTLSEKHPDIKKLKKEIGELEAQVGTSDDSVEKVRKLSELEGQLAALRGKLGPKHPDVVKLSRQVENLSKEVDNLITEKAKTEVSEEKPDNPAYISLMTQIAAADGGIKSLLDEKRETKQKMEVYQMRAENAPSVEKEYNELTRDYESARTKHSEIMAKLMTARVAEGMEQTQRGERFIISEPAYLPEKPYKPNRLAVMLLGFILALGGGVGLATAREFMDNSIKTEDELSNLVGVPVFSAVSLQESDEDRRARRIRRILWVLVAIGVIIAALILVNQFIMPLDILWIKVQRRLEMMGLPF